jgi:hypothetical protein
MTFGENHQTPSYYGKYEILYIVRFTDQALAGGPEAGELLAVVDDSGRVKLFNWPCVVEHAPYRRMEWAAPAGGATKPTGRACHPRDHHVPVHTCLLLRLLVPSLWASNF